MSDKDARAKRRAKQRQDERHIPTGLGRQGDTEATKDTPAAGYRHATIVVRWAAWAGSGLLPQPLNLELPAHNGVVTLRHIEVAVDSFLRASAHGMPPGGRVDVEANGLGAVFDGRDGNYGHFSWNYAPPTTPAPGNLTK